MAKSKRTEETVKGQEPEQEKKTQEGSASEPTDISGTGSNYEESDLISVPD